jgi:hypothetical protein
MFDHDLTPSKLLRRISGGYIAIIFLLKTVPRNNLGISEYPRKAMRSYIREYDLGKIFF